MARFQIVSSLANEEFAVATYATGSAPPAETIPFWAKYRGGWWVPTRPLGYLANRLLFSGRWTVRVSAWRHDGPSWTTRRPSQQAADATAEEIMSMVRSGRWNPDLEPLSDIRLES